MSKQHPGFRIFILGAGFSQPAGLPLGSELFLEARNLIETKYGTATKFQSDIEDYIKYKSSCGEEGFNENNIDFEDFMSYMDIEHALRLRGSKGWSDEGNESQLMIRKAIGKVIQSRTPSYDNLPSIYYQFAENLTVNDIVITLNYDVILERALEYVKKPFRLFPHRYKSVGRHTHTVDSDVEELTVYKLHGSVDWFDDRYFLESIEDLKAQGITNIPVHSVFENRTLYNVNPIVDGLRPDHDPLGHIHKVGNIDTFYQRDNDFIAPLILSPSHVKFVYSKPLLDLWWGIGRGGGYNLGLNIIGFSLPQHDEYLRIVLYKLVTNYQSWWGTKMLDYYKDNIKLVDYRGAGPDIENYKSRYNFIDSEKVRYKFTGWNDEAVDFLFKDIRQD